MDVREMDVRETDVFSREPHTPNSSNCSKGNQMKMCENSVWYKADYLGYEAASEYATSVLLGHSNAEFVSYEICDRVFGKTKQVGCKSKDFLKSGQNIVTLHKLFKKNLGVDISVLCSKMSVSDAIQWVVSEVINLTGLYDFGSYLSGMFALDAIILNEDRHFRNIAVLQTETGFSYCPIFDNGAAFLSNTYSYPKGCTDRQCLEKYFDEIEVKPFGHSFDEQLDICEELYGTPLFFRCKDLAKECETEILKYYDEEVLTRIDFVFREMKRKYAYLFK